MEWWNGGFFSLTLFACLCTNYYQEYITLKQRSVQIPVENIEIKIGCILTTVATSCRVPVMHPLCKLIRNGSR